MKKGKKIATWHHVYQKKALLRKQKPVQNWTGLAIVDVCLLSGGNFPVAVHKCGGNHEVVGVVHTFVNEVLFCLLTRGIELSCAQTPQSFTGFCISLRPGFFIPVNCLCSVLPYPVTIFIAQTETKLCVCITLFC